MLPHYCMSPLHTSVRKSIPGCTHYAEKARLQSCQGVRMWKMRKAIMVRARVHRLNDFCGRHANMHSEEAPFQFKFERQFMSPDQFDQLSEHDPPNP